jgi:hypothetical protein
VVSLFGKKQTQDTGSGAILGSVMETSAPRRSKTKVRLMTEQEEKDRSFRAAREHYIAQVVNREVRRDQFHATSNSFFRQVFAYVGLAVLFVALFWMIQHQDVLSSWWNRMVDVLRTI